MNAVDDQRIKEISRMHKDKLARMHKYNGGLMPLSDYLRWSHDELVNAVIEDEDTRTIFGPGGILDS